MKKSISIILAIIMILGTLCFSVSAATKVTDSGIKVEIAPFLYKSKQYQMKYPSVSSYAIKELSTEGDYAISREINDLSYSFTFPAGTTKIECLISLNGENDWKGVRINSSENSIYWPTDNAGNIDYSLPFTFSRDEALAEQDEYGVLYRDFLKNAAREGFRDFDKIYWKLIYTCNGTEYTDYFDIRLYDYDNSEKQLVRTVNFNVAGLPFAALQGEDVGANQKLIANYLTENSFDIVAVQEDFGYHSQLVDDLDKYLYKTIHTGSIPGGDGLNIFTQTMPVYNETRVEWEDACGILTDGSDELTPKGFVYTVIDIGNGIYVDFYNLHADAYGGKGSKEARTSQFKQIAEFIEARTAENNRPVIVTGDFNNHLHTQEDNNALYEIFYNQCGFKDAWMEYHNDGNYIDMSKWYATELPAWGNWDSVERFFYRSGGGVDITVSDFRYVDVTDSNGKAVSDHAAAECDFLFVKTADFTENTQELSTVTSNGRDFFYQIRWIFKALMLIFSDIDNLSAILDELF